MWSKKNLKTSFSTVSGNVRRQEPPCTSSRGEKKPKLGVGSVGAKARGENNKYLSCHHLQGGRFEPIVDKMELWNNPSEKYARQIGFIFPK